MEVQDELDDVERKLERRYDSDRMDAMGNCTGWMVQRAARAATRNELKQDR